jgi:hypothetical protein
MFGKEPVVIITALVTIAQGIAIFVLADVGLDFSTIIPILLPILGGLFAREKVMPVETVKEAGLDPAKVKADAENPHIERVVP